MWKIINNRAEIINKEVYKTKEEAEKVVEMLIKISVNGYDYDIEEFSDDELNMTYSEWIEIIENL